MNEMLNPVTGGIAVAVFLLGYLLAYLIYARFKTYYRRAQKNLEEVSERTADLSSKVTVLTQNAESARLNFEHCRTRIADLEQSEKKLQQHLEKRDDYIIELHKYNQQAHQVYQKDYETLWQKLQDSNSAYHHASQNEAMLRTTVGRLEDEAVQLRETVRKLTTENTGLNQAKEDLRREREVRERAEIRIGDLEAQLKDLRKILGTEPGGEVGTSIADLKSGMEELRKEVSEMTAMKAGPSSNRKKQEHQTITLMTRIRRMFGF